MQFGQTALAATVLILASQLFGQQNTAPERMKREDIGALFSREICKRFIVPNLTHLWPHNIYDAQIEIQTLTPKGGKPVTAGEVAKATKILADRLNHYGMAQGQCPDGRFWVVTTPAPQNTITREKDFLKISNTIFSHYCDEARVDYVGRDAGKPREILRVRDYGKEKHLQVNTKLLSDGVISVTCNPRYPSWQGPILWSLVPIGKGPGDFIPEEKHLEMGDSDHTRLLSWINAIRKKEGLSALSENHPRMSWLGEQLLKNSSVKHNHNMLKQAGKIFQKHGGRFLGENRVKGESARDMAWLLWHSPRHRGLLLNKEASHIAVALAAQKEETLAVVALGRLKDGG